MVCLPGLGSENLQKFGFLRAARYFAQYKRYRISGHSLKDKNENLIALLRSSIPSCPMVFRQSLQARVEQKCQLNILHSTR